MHPTKRRRWDVNGVNLENSQTKSVRQNAYLVQLESTVLTLDKPHVTSVYMGLTVRPKACMSVQSAPVVPIIPYAAQKSVFRVQWESII